MTSAPHDKSAAKPRVAWLLPSDMTYTETEPPKDKDFYVHVIDKKYADQLEAELKEAKQLLESETKKSVTAHVECFRLHERLDILNGKFTAANEKIKELEWFADKINEYVDPGFRDSKDSALKAFKDLTEENRVLKDGLLSIVPLNHEGPYQAISAPRIAREALAAAAAKVRGEK